VSAGKEAPHTRKSRRKTGREPSLRAKVAPGLIVGGLLMATSWAMFDSNYLEPRQTLNEGVAGEFTLDSCDSSGSSGGGRTVCTGTFRSADGRSVVKDLALSEKNDASGLQRGDAFPARATLSQYGTRQVYATTTRAGAISRRTVSVRPVSGWSD
jgi:hypothetical protein